MSTRSDLRAIRGHVEVRLVALRARSYAELCALPPHATEEVPCGRRVFCVTTYRDAEPGAVRVVVQALPRGAGCIWTEAQAAGFRRRATGETDPVAEAELFEFT